MSEAIQSSTLKLLRLNQIIGDHKRGIQPIIPVSKSTWWEWVKEGKAPSPIRLGKRSVAWRSDDIKNLINKLSMNEGYNA